jgi:hypothetical protein
MNWLNKIGLTTLACIAVAFGTATVATATTVITDYAVYGENGVFIGAGSTVNGLTGGRFNDPGNGNAIKLNGLANINGDARSGGNVNLQNNAHIIGDLYRATGTTLTMGSGSTVGSDNVVADPMLPVFPGLPVASLTCPTGGPNKSGANSQTLTLTPGSYGSVTYGGLFTLILNGAGDYYFDSIHTGNGARIILATPGVRVFVCGAAYFGSLDILPTNLSPSDFFMEVHATGANAFYAGGSSDIIGVFFAPYGELHFGGSGCCSTLFGRLLGNSVDIEHGTTVTPPNTMCPLCACVDSFTPTNGPVGTVVTLTGKALDNVEHLFFSTTCSGGTEGTILTQTSTTLTVSVPNVAPGDYHIIVNSCTGTYCTTATFTVQ